MHVHNIDVLLASTMHPLSVQSELKRSLREAVDGGLMVLGEAVRQVIYYHIEESHQVEPEQIPDRIEPFHEALRNMFGEGANHIEKLIIKHLYSTLALKFEEHEDWTLVDYVREAKIQIGEGG